MNNVTKITTITGVEDDRDIVVIILSVKRTTEDGSYASITDGQKDAAMNAAKTVMQVLGADVNANSSAILIPSTSLGQNAPMRVNVQATVEKIEDNEE